jgi:hypothetical protein
MGLSLPFSSGWLKHALIAKSKESVSRTILFVRSKVARMGASVNFFLSS